MPGQIAELADRLRARPGALVFTGAGMSTESGIPDFRSPATGLYSSIDPMDYFSVDALCSHPVRFWNYLIKSYCRFADARPNAGHLALAELERSGHVAAVVTQNVDGLHQAAGSRAVLEIHGNLRETHCLDCFEVYPLASAFEQIGTNPETPPYCPRCSGRLRPDLVLFDDPLPPAFNEAERLVRGCELVLVIGSSLAVWPANELPRLARQLAIINLQPTDSDEYAAVVIRGGIGETLTMLAAMLR